MKTKVKNPFKKLRLMFKEIDNYFFYIRQIEMFDDSGDMRSYKIKMDKKHGIYGAINLQPELLLRTNSDELEQVEKTIFGAELAKLNDMLLKYEIMELYKVQYERVKTEDYYAYVYYISYNWKHCTKASIITASIAFLTIALSITGLLLYWFL